MAASGATPTGAVGGDAGALVDAARDFVVGRVLPNHAALERGELDLRGVLAEAGSAGILEVDRGCEVAAEPLAAQLSVAVAAAAHSTLASAAIARCGSDALRATLEARARGERIGAFAMTEPESGSDVLAMRARARRDGRDWIVQGRKQMVTNATICDDVVVFAHADAAGPIALVVPRDAPGVTIGAQEPMVGLRGTSTCAIALDGVRVPPEALLDEPGRGHRAALDVLPRARLRSGTLALGHARFLTAVTARHARERRQFGQPIAAFGIVAAKLGEMVARAFVVESVLRRAAAELDDGDPDELLPLASACKVLGTEMVARVTDLALAVYAGGGYLRGSWAEQSLRDVRGLRLYDGTNEIARRSAYGALRKMVVRGTLVLDQEVQGDAANRERTSARSLSAWLRVVLRSSVRTASGGGDAAMAGRDELEGAIADLAFASAASDAAQARARAATAGFSSDAHLVALAADAGVLLAYQDVMPGSQGLRVALGREVPALPLPTGAGPALDLPAALVALGRAAVEVGRDPLAPYDFPVLPNGFDATDARA